MSLTLMLILLFIIEIVAIAAIVAAILRLKSSKQSELVEIYRRRLAEYEQKLEDDVVDLNNIGEKLTQLLRPIKDITFKHRKIEGELFDKRVEFIQAEISALANKEYGEHYWDKLCIRLGDLMPSPEIDPSNSTENEQDSGGLLSVDDDVPVLSQKINLDKNIATIAYVTLTPLQNEIKRLKRIVGRHFGTLSDLKQAITENSQDSSNAINLSKTLKDLQIVHVQLTRSVKTIRDEHARISRILSSKTSIAGGSANMLDDSKQKALDAIRQSQPQSQPKSPQPPLRKRSGKS